MRAYTFLCVTLPAPLVRANLPQLALPLISAVGLVLCLAALVLGHLGSLRAAGAERRAGAEALASALLREADVARAGGTSLDSWAKQSLDRHPGVLSLSLREGETSLVQVQGAKDQAVLRATANAGPLSVEVGVRAAAGSQPLLGLELALALLALAVGGGGFALAALLRRRAREMEQAAMHVGSGVLSRPLAPEAPGEWMVAASSLDALAANLRELVVEARSTLQTITGETKTLQGSAARQTALASDQSGALVEAALTLGEIASSSKLASEQSDRVLTSMGRSEEVTRDGRRAVEDTRAAMTSLGAQVEIIAQAIGVLVERTSEIGKIVGTVQDLADQSNLLALNASIEASRAGESGQGFVVVAQEMRNLATQSKAGANRIRLLLADLHTATRTALEASREGMSRADAANAVSRAASSAIEALAGVISESSEAARLIADQAHTQTVSVEQVARSLNDLSEAMKQLLELAETLEKGAGGLSRYGAELSARLDRYHT